MKSVPDNKELKKYIEDLLKPRYVSDVPFSALDVGDHVIGADETKGIIVVVYEGTVVISWNGKMGVTYGHHELDSVTYLGDMPEATEEQFKDAKIVKPNA